MDYLYILLLIALQIVFVFQLYYILVVQRKLAVYRVPEDTAGYTGPVSVIICARNELQNLQNNLAYFLDQDYPQYEVVVVNDCSADGTDWYLRDLEKEHPKLKVVTLTEHPRFKHGKKFAVTIGIKASSYEQMVFSDADCRPASRNWLTRMASHFSEGCDIIIGYSPYEIRRGLLNAFIRFETFQTALNYFSFALSGNPYMGVGRNLAYRKETFFKGKGFASHMHIASGDDDLFVNQNANAVNTSVELHPDGHVWSSPKSSWSSYFTQKLRHQGAGKEYRKKHKDALTSIALTGFLFYVLLIVLIIIKAQWWLLAGVYVVRLVCQLLVYVPSMRKLRYPDLAWYLPVLDFIYYIYIVIVSCIAVFKKRVEWK